MGRPSQFNVALLVVLAGVATARADQIRTWKDAEGHVHYSIVGDPQAAPVAPSDEPSGRDESPERFSIEASLRRKTIEAALQKGSAELVRLRNDIDETEKRQLLVTSPGAPARNANPGEVQQLLDAQRTAFLTAKSFDEDKRRKLGKLRRAERRQLGELGQLWDDFEDLRAEVRERYGDFPAWWRDRLDCRGCPGPEGIEEVLLEMDEERERPKEESSAENASREAPSESH